MTHHAPPTDVTRIKQDIIYEVSHTGRNRPVLLHFFNLSSFYSDDVLFISSLRNVCHRLIMFQMVGRTQAYDTEPQFITSFSVSDTNHLHVCLHLSWLCTLGLIPGYIWQSEQWLASPMFPRAAPKGCASAALTLCISTSIFSLLLRLKAGNRSF